jgi:hypothetical protein
MRVRAFLAIALFTVLWIFLVLPRLVDSAGFQSQPPPLQYLAYNLGFLILFVGLSWIVLRSPGLGLVGFLDFSLVLDNLQPPFAYNSAGELVIEDQGSLVGASVDRTLGWLATDVLHLQGSPVFVFIYVVVPILAVALTLFVVRRRRRRVGPEAA